MSTKEEIDITYGVNNDFFALWLDKSMAYTCGLFLDGNETLEEAQIKKHAFLSRAARVEPGSRVLDIGCGWGANLDYLSRVAGAGEAVGITLSKDQYAAVQARNIPRSSVHYVDYRDYRPERIFDSIISIGMFEHVATPAQTRRGEHIDIYRDYFRKAWEWSRPGASFGLQSVVGAKIPRGAALREIAWATSAIFPGAISPRLESIFQSAHPYWEVIELQTRRMHYARTTTEWLERLRSHEGRIRAEWGNAPASP